MKYLIRTGLLAFLFLSFCGFSTNIQTDENVIHWEQSHRLSWNDFEGSAPFGKTFHAETFTGIGYSYTPVKKGDVVEIEWDVHCYFDKHLSWVRKDLRTNALLKHEQAHFDITEMYARELRKKLGNAQLNLENAQKVIESHYQDVLKDMQEYHNLYDKVTRHGINSHDQLEWERMISNELTKLYAYGS